MGRETQADREEPGTPNGEKTMNHRTMKNLTEVRNSQQALAELLAAAARNESANLSVRNEEIWQAIRIDMMIELSGYDDVERADAPNEFWGCAEDGIQVRGYMSIDG